MRRKTTILLLVALITLTLPILHAEHTVTVNINVNTGQISRSIDQATSAIYNMGKQITKQLNWIGNYLEGIGGSIVFLSFMVVLASLIIVAGMVASRYFDTKLLYDIAGIVIQTMKEQKTRQHETEIKIEEEKKKPEKNTDREELRLEEF